MSQYQSGQYGPIKDRVLLEWKAFSGWAFEEMVRTLLREELAARYDCIGSWWNRRGDEIDLLALKPDGNLAVEIKNLDLSLSQARGLLSALEKKIPLVKGLSGPVTLGIAARAIEGKEILIQEGYFIRDLADMGIG